jgi:hypothetical protein
MTPSFSEVAKNGTLHPSLIGRWGNRVHDYKAADSPSSLSHPALLSPILCQSLLQRVPRSRSSSPLICLPAWSGFAHIFVSPDAA